MRYSVALSGVHICIMLPEHSHVRRYGCCHSIFFELMQFVSSMLPCCKHAGQKQHHRKISDRLQCPCWCPSLLPLADCFLNANTWYCLPRLQSLPTHCCCVIDADAGSLHCCSLIFPSMFCARFAVTADCAMLQCCQCRCRFTFAPLQLWALAALSSRRYVVESNHSKSK